MEIASVRIHDSELLQTAGARRNLLDRFTVWLPRRSSGDPRLCVHLWLGEGAGRARDFDSCGVQFAELNSEIAGRRFICICEIL
jgi:hypothetical protein